MQTISKQVNNEILEILVNNTGTTKRTGNKQGIKAYLIASFIIGGIFALAITLNHLGLLKEA